MTQPDLTPLATLASFTPPLRERLRRYWISSAEEFLTTARLANPGYGSGMRALVEVLEQPLDQVRALYEVAQEALPGGPAFDLLPEITVATGAILDDTAFDLGVSFDLPIDLPEAVWLGAGLPPALNQGLRSTCVAFTLVAMYQQLNSNPADLSEQFVYWACKQHDQLADLPGTTPEAGMMVMRQVGACAEQLWPYHPEPIAQHEDQGPPPDQAAALDDARQRRISGFTQLPPRSVLALKARLAHGHALLIGMPAAEHWVNSWQARALGRVRPALPGEQEGALGGHALCVLGYRNDPTAPGHGYLIARNSWGTGWGYANSDAPGYVHIPYALVAELNRAAYSFEKDEG